MQKLDYHPAHALHSVAATRQIEQQLQSTLPANTLMQRAGLAVAQLALALAPHSRRIWVACGPGNNGGDGLEAAVHLQQWGKNPVVTCVGDPQRMPADAAAAYQRARSAGVTFSDAPPDCADLCIDALLGIGAQARPPEGAMASWIERMNAGVARSAGKAPILAVDLPTGLHADTGMAASISVHAQHTLSLLTLKPGLFTAHGRDVAGDVWLADLGVSEYSGNFSGPESAETAWLSGAPQSPKRAHATHKGSYGDVVVVGGARGMTGATILAATSALTAGAGRVFVSLLDDDGPTLDSCQPELMFRALATLDLSPMTVVCGCGGGDAIAQPLARVLAESGSLVLDADALNAIAKQPPLQALLSARAIHMARTVMTPHPLEAARLLNCTAAVVQGDRLTAAQTLAERFGCVVVLKGSGTVVATPQQTPFINPTGNAALATAGTGDVLAGMVGAGLAAGQSALQAACDAVYRHGLLADAWPASRALTAGALSRAYQKQ